MKRDAGATPAVTPSLLRDTKAARPLATERRRGSAVSAGGGSDVASARRKSGVDEERAWRLGRPGRATAQKALGGAGDGGGGFRPWREPASSPAGSGLRHRVVVQDAEPLVQIFVSPRRAAGTAVTAAVAAPAAPLPVPVPVRRISSSSGSSAVSSSIQSARTLLSDIGRLLGHAPTHPIASTAGDPEEPEGVPARPASSAPPPAPDSPSSRAPGSGGSDSLARTMAAYDAALGGIDAVGAGRRTPAPAASAAVLGGVSEPRGPTPPAPSWPASSAADAALAESSRLRLCVRLLQLSDRVRAYDREMLRLAPADVSAAAEAAAPPPPAASLPPEAAPDAPLGSLLPPALERVFAAVVGGQMQPPGSGALLPSPFRGFGAPQLRALLLPGQRGTLAYLWANRKDAIAEWEFVRGQLGGMPLPRSPAAAPGPTVTTAAQHTEAPTHPHQEGSPPALFPARGADAASGTQHASATRESAAVSAAAAAAAESALMEAAGPDLAALFDRAERLASPPRLGHQQQQQQQPEPRTPPEELQRPHSLSPAARAGSWGAPPPALEAWEGVPSPPQHLKAAGPAAPAASAPVSGGPERHHHWLLGAGLAAGDLAHDDAADGEPFPDRAASRGTPTDWRERVSPPQPPTSTTIYLSAAARPVRAGTTAVPASPWLGAGADSAGAAAPPPSGAPPRTSSSSSAYAEIPPQQPRSHLPQPPPAQWGVSERAGASVYVRASKAAATRLQQQQRQAQAQTQPLQLRSGPRIVAEELVDQRWVPLAPDATTPPRPPHSAGGGHLQRLFAQSASASTAPRGGGSGGSSAGRSSRVDIPSFIAPPWQAPQPPPSHWQQQPQQPPRQPLPQQPLRPSALLLYPPQLLSPPSQGAEKGGAAAPPPPQARWPPAAPPFAAVAVAPLLPPPPPLAVAAPPPHAPASTLAGHDRGRARPKRPHACAGEGIHVEEEAAETAQAAAAALGAFHATFRAAEAAAGLRAAAVGAGGAGRGMTLTELAAL